MVRELRDNLNSGLHDIAPSRVYTTAGRSMRCRKKHRRVKHRQWGEETRADEPILFSQDKSTFMMREIKRFANEVGDALRSNGGAGRKVNPPRELFAGRAADREVKFGSGYFKAHLSVSACNDFIPGVQLPIGIMVRGPNVTRTPVIVFLNTKDGQSNTHFDRDTSVLMLCRGNKEVKISPPIPGWKRSNDGILEGVNPFSMDSDEHGEHSWETVSMKPGSLLLIPKGWIHCVRSTRMTIAFSFQVCGEGMN